MKMKIYNRNLISVPDDQERKAAVAYKERSVINIWADDLISLQNVIAYRSFRVIEWIDNIEIEGQDQGEASAETPIWRFWWISVRSLVSPKWSMIHSGEREYWLASDPMASSSVRCLESAATQYLYVLRGS